ncbi:hypothetical protein DB345_13035 [Spartobacteria bacterium LR76]|nr:hypothetical protein DB345_13035 [Spartobacteria bacterium LR76]
MYQRHLIEERRKLAQYVRESEREISQWEEDLEQLEIRTRRQVELAGLKGTENPASSFPNIIPLRKHAA